MKRLHNPNRSNHRKIQTKARLAGFWGRSPLALFVAGITFFSLAALPGCQSDDDSTDGATTLYGLHLNVSDENQTAITEAEINIHGYDDEGNHTGDIITTNTSGGAGSTDAEGNYESGDKLNGNIEIRISKDGYMIANVAAKIEGTTYMSVTLPTWSDQGHYCEDELNITEGTYPAWLRVHKEENNSESFTESDTLTVKRVSPELAVAGGADLVTATTAATQRSWLDIYNDSTESDDSDGHIDATVEANISGGEDPETLFQVLLNGESRYVHTRACSAGEYGVVMF